MSSNMKPWLCAVLVTAYLLGCQAESAVPSITVEGAVAHPGVHPCGPDTTAFEAVQLAGPVAVDANLARVELLRTAQGGLQRLELDLARMQSSGDSSSNVLVRPGDILRVPRR